MGRMTKTSKANLLVCDRIELDYNSIFQSYHVRLFKGDNLAYLSDSEGAMSYDSIAKARRAVKRIRPDLEPTTI